MSDLKDHDPDEGEWIAFNLMTGGIQVDPSPHLPARYRNGYRPGEIPRRAVFDTIEAVARSYFENDDNPNLVRGYN